MKNSQLVWKGVYTSIKLEVRNKGAENTAVIVKELSRKFLLPGQ